MKSVQDLYPLSPMQRTMLLHALTAVGGDTLFNQFVYEVRGGIDVSAGETAWQQVLERHDSLRTAFVWEDLPEPLQVVKKRAALPFESLDWSAMRPGERAAALASYLAKDRAAGFDLGRGPLMRVGLVRCSDTLSYLVWSSHHLVLDRWCVAVVLEDFVRCYEARRTAPSGSPVGGPAPAGRFRDYVGWLQSQDEERAHAYWRSELRGVGHATRRLSQIGNAPIASSQRKLSVATTEALRAGARALGVTPSTVLQGAWAMVLHQASKRDDVVFGATVAGRPPELAGVESIVGSFISNVPVRVQFAAADSVADWLKTMHRRQQERSAYEFLAAPDIHELSGLPATEPLFDSLLVWLAPVASQQPGSFELCALPGSVATTWPVTVSITDADSGIEVVLQRAAGLDDELSPEQVLEQLERNVTAILADPSRTVGELDGFEAAAGLTGAAGRNGRALEPIAAVAGPRRRSPASAGREEEELSMVQEMLLGECRAILGTESISLDDNFFECGGNSLRAAHLHSQVEKVTGRAVPLLSMFQAATLGEMAQLLTQQRWPVRTDMVRPVRRSGTQTPLLCISSPEVSSLGYVLMARYLDPDQPVYLVQSLPGTDQVCRMAITQIPDLAAEYLEAVRRFQPSGPYRLLGMCDGALLAVEVGRRLRAAGESVEFVGVLNTYSLNTLSRLNYVRRVETRARYYASRLATFSRLGWRRQRSEVGRVLRQRLQPITRAFGGFAAAPSPSASPSASQPAGETANAATATVDAAEAAVPSTSSIQREWQDLDWPSREPLMARYPGTITVFRIKKQPYFRIRDRFLGWGDKCDSVDLVRLDSDRTGWAPDLRGWREVHLDILREPNVRQTAAAVSASLQKLAGESPA